MAKHLIRLSFLPHLAACTVVLSLSIAPDAAFAWGRSFTDAAREAALAQLDFELDVLPPDDGWPLEWLDESCASTRDPVGSTEEAVDELAQAIAGGDPFTVASAVDRLVSVATDLWQPLTAAGMLDPPGAAPGLNFRYEVLLAERATCGISPWRVAESLPSVEDRARLIVAEREPLASDLAHADERARAVTGGLYNETYYTLLWDDLGADLEVALRGAADTAADLMATAWGQSGRSGGEPAAALELTVAELAGGQLSVVFFLPSTERATAALYNIEGRKLMTLHDGVLAQGFHRVTLARGTARPPGVTFLRLKAGAKVATAKLPYVN